MRQYKGYKYFKDTDSLWKVIIKDTIIIVALLAITFCWCHLTGQWRYAHTPIKIKKHGRKAKSLFRYGLDYLREVLLNLSERSQDFRKMIQVLLNSIVN